VRSLLLGRILVVIALLAVGAPPAGAVEDHRLLEIEGAGVKWGAPRAGVGAVVGYALVTGRRSFPGARNCGEMAPLDGLAAAAGLPLAAVEAEIEAALAMWSSAADIRFERSPAGEVAELVIGAQTDARGFAWANLAVGRDEDGMRPIHRALVCLNPERPWTAGGEGLDLRSVLAHEIGHILGLDHPAARDQVMSFSFEARRDALRHGDVRGVRRLYGPPPEPLAAARPTLRPPRRIHPASTETHDGPAAFLGRWVSR
jgi:hypothetical protein